MGHSYSSSYRPALRTILSTNRSYSNLRFRNKVRLHAGATAFSPSCRTSPSRKALCILSQLVGHSLSPSYPAPGFEQTYNEPLLFVFSFRNKVRLHAAATSLNPSCRATPFRKALCILSQPMGHLLSPSYTAPGFEQTFQRT